MSTHAAPRRAPRRAASSPPPPPLPRQARRRPSACSTSPGSSSSAPSPASTAPSTSLAPRPSRCSSTRSRSRAPAYSLAITAGGATWSWGEGGSGQLGHGDGQTQLLPKVIEALAKQRVVAVSAGVFHSIALTANGSVWSWGHGGVGRLGNGDGQDQWLPKKIDDFAGQRVVAASAGTHHSLAITADGAVWSWGGGTFGKMGHGDEQRQLLPEKVEAFTGRRVVVVSAGERHSLARTADGALFAWGQGNRGCLGHGEDLSNQLLPKKVAAWALGL